jgi:hypothetical protein
MTENLSEVEHEAVDGTLPFVASERLSRVSPRFLT